MPALRKVAGRGVKTMAALADRVRTPQRGVVVLLYHRVGARGPSEVDLPAALFDEQMAWLAARGVVATIDDALGTLSRPEPPPHDPVVVTFDDGTADLADVALPILVTYRVPAVIYLSTDFIETGRPFPGNGTPLSWSAVRDAVSTGLVTIGSHTHTHALLDRLDVQAAAAELDRSKDLIAERARVDADHFAYPKAVGAPRPVEALVRERFRSAALGGNRANPYGRTDPHRLARSAIQRSDGMRFFEHKAVGGMALEDRARRALNRVRYARASA
ncbi:MAG: polysaccharide deacetylase family protein [Jiangellaceae bacterium]